MKRHCMVLMVILTATVLHAEPVAYQCAPLAMPDPDWLVTYTYSTSDGLMSGSNTLVIGRVDMATNSVVPAHMESRLLPKSKYSALFFATYEPTFGLKMEWRIRNHTEATTNTCFVPPGLNTNAILGTITYSVRWKRGVEPTGARDGVHAAHDP